MRQVPAGDWIADVEAWESGLLFMRRCLSNLGIVWKVCSICWRSIGTVDCMLGLWAGNNTVYNSRFYYLTCIHYSYNHYRIRRTCGQKYEHAVNVNQP